MLGGKCTPFEYQFRRFPEQNLFHFGFVIPILDVYWIMEILEPFLLDRKAVQLTTDIPNEDFTLVSEGVGSGIQTDRGLQEFRRWRRLPVRQLCRDSRGEH